MKQLNKTLPSILALLVFLTSGIHVLAQDSVAAEPTVTLRYFARNNSTQYLLVQTSLKKGKKSEPLPKQVVKVFLDSNSLENLITKTYTDEFGKITIAFPPSLKDKWKSSPKHNFIAVMEATSPEDERTAALEITRSKIVIDTSNTDGIRTVNVKVMSFENNTWVPANDVEMMVGVDRSGAVLSAGDEATYTTDSTGTVSVELKKQNLPGDEKGNFVLVAKVEDNDRYGNLLVKKTVPWGVVLKQSSNFFDQRTLWSTRFRTPLWLLFMAYSIMITVWTTIIYLVWQIVKIKKLGVAG